MPKPTRKPKKLKNPQDASLCDYCNRLNGARSPKSNPRMIGVTVCMGFCESCGDWTGIVPACDYDWPKTGSKAIFD